MGNYLAKGTHIINNNDNDKNVRTDLTEVPESSLCTSSRSIEIARETGESLYFHIFSYQQHYMPFKKRQIYKWASAKLVLTEELIRTNKLRIVQLKQCSYLEPDTDYLTDDEMEEEVSIDKQLCSLENYRMELVELIGRLSLGNRSNSQKLKKVKRLKRRTLLSKKQFNQNIENNEEANVQILDFSKLVLNYNRDGIIKRSPFKDKNY